MTNTAPTTATKRPMNPDPTLKTVRFKAHGLLLESNPDAIREPTPECRYLRHVRADLRDAIREPTPETTPDTTSELLLKSTPNTDHEATLEPTSDTTRELILQSTPNTDHKTTLQSTPNTHHELILQSTPNTHHELILQSTPNTDHELILESTPSTDHALTLEPAPVPTREVPLARHRDGSPQRRRGDRGEGVISAAIAVLIIAFLGAAMWVGFNTVWEDAEENITDQVEKIGSTTSAGN